MAYKTHHSPFQVPDADFERVAARGLDDRTTAVCAMVENLDARVGRLLEALDDGGGPRATRPGEPVISPTTSRGGIVAGPHTGQEERRNV